MGTRSQTQIYLLGSTVTDILGCKLPSNCQVFGLFLHLHLTEHLTIRSAATEVIQKVFSFWYRARIPLRQLQHCISKLEKLFSEWTVLKKHKNRETPLHKQKETAFLDSLEDLFDVAHADALQLIKIPEDRDFLLAQREKGRHGVMGSADQALADRERRAKKFAEQEEKRRLEAKAYADQMANKASTEDYVSCSTSSTEDDTDNENPQVEVRGSGSPKPKRLRRARKKIITPGLAAALDRTGISSRQATFVLAEAAKCFGHDMADVNVNRMSIHRHRKQHRAQFVKEYKSKFPLSASLVVHWDGKLMEDLTSKQHVDRLPVIVTGEGISQLLGVPKIASGTGEAQASAVKCLIDEWNLCDRVGALCFDTTASNTGNKAGACNNTFNAQSDCMDLHDGSGLHIDGVSCDAMGRGPRHNFLEAVTSGCQGYYEIGCHYLEVDDYAILKPYFEGHKYSHRHRVLRDCQPIRFGNLTFEQLAAHSSAGPDTNNIQLRHFAQPVGTSADSRTVLGHHVIIGNPSQTVSVLEPRGETGGCDLRLQETVTETASLNNCILAINAGFFNVTDGACLGNVVSDGRLVRNTHGIQNVHFGIKKDGNLFFGYLSESEIQEHSFKHLVGGVIWLVRNGEVYVDISKKSECPDTQLTGHLQEFIDVLSSRTAVGHDIEGRLIIVQVDGKTRQRGLNLYEFAEMLISFGVVNAINLDGGGSSTMVANGSLINYPSDTVTIDGLTYITARNVSTILCVRDLPCSPGNCSGHGVCHRGVCQCHDNWQGSACDNLQCGVENCTQSGICTEEISTYQQEDGCKCFAGWQGANCSSPCLAGYYGLECSERCKCSVKSRGCDPVDGHCYCTAGYHGYNCDAECPLGTYGKDCSSECQCHDNCFCDRVTGSCSSVNDTFWQDGQCMGELRVVSQRSAVLSVLEYWWWIGGLVTFSVIAASSLVLNVFLLCRQIKCVSSTKSPSRTYQMLPSRGTNIVYDASPLMDDITTSDSDEEYYRRTFVPSSSLSRAGRGVDSREANHRSSFEDRNEPVRDRRNSDSSVADASSANETFPMVKL